jgi:hypothetical protein
VPPRGVALSEAERSALIELVRHTLNLPPSSKRIARRETLEKALRELEGNRA